MQNQKNQRVFPVKKRKTGTRKANVFLEKVLKWVRKHPEDFLGYKEVDAEKVKDNLEKFENANDNFYSSLKEFHAIRRKEKEKRRIFSKEYQKIINELKNYYKKDKTIDEFKIGKRGALLEEKLEKLHSAFRKHGKKLNGNIRYELSDIEDLVIRFNKMKKEIENSQKIILTARRKREKVFNEIRIFSQRCRHLIFARYAGEPEKKKSFISG